jgi:hypothetical protein
MENPRPNRELESGNSGQLWLPPSDLQVPATQAEITSPAPPSDRETAREPVVYTTDRPIAPNESEPADENLNPDVRPTPGESPVEVQDEALAAFGYGYALWHPVNFTELHHTDIAPFTVVRGVASIRDFDAVEKAVVASLSPLTAHRGEQAALNAEHIIAADRVSNHLRPGAASGRLQDGHAVILPFDAERAIAHGKRFANSLPLESPDAKAVGVVYTGVLKSSKGTIGRVILESTYFPRRLSLLTTYDGYLRRSLGREDVIKDLEGTVRDNNRYSGAVSLLMARYFNANVYRGGDASPR